MQTDIKQLRRWINWDLKQVGDRLTKTPIMSRSHFYASVSEPDTWSIYADAVKDGRPLGFVLDKSVGLCIVDFDKVRESTTDPWPDWVLEEVAQLDSFTEVSASGKGLHVLCWGSIPRNMNRQGCHTEIWDSHKMFCLTFNVFEGRDVIQQRDLSALHQRIEEGRIGPDYKPQLLAESYNKDKYEDIINLRYAEHGLGRSEAVASALWTLASKHKFDADKMRKEFEETPLCKDYHVKWARLGEWEIKRAIEEVRKRKSPPEEFKLSFQFDRVVMTKREYVLKPKFKFDGWLMRGSVSVIGGSSGAGKTTLMLDVLDRQSRGETFLGHVGSGWPFLTVFTDRGYWANQETFERMGLNIRSMNIAHLGMCVGDRAVERILASIEKSSPMPKVVFIEGADLLVEDGNAAKHVAPFMKGIQDIAERYAIAFVLSVGAPKRNKDNKDGLKRDGLIGSQMWGRTATTIITIEHEGDGTGPARRVFVLHRNSGNEKFAMAFNDEGKLEVRNIPSTGMSLNAWASRQGVFERTDVKKYFQASWPSVKVALNGLISGGAVREISKGKFEYVRPDFAGEPAGVTGTVAIHGTHCAASQEVA